LSSLVFTMLSDDGHVTTSNSSQPIRVPQFHGDSFLGVPLRRPPSRSLSFEIWFLTYEPNGTTNLFSVVFTEQTLVISGGIRLMITTDRFIRSNKTF